MAHVAPSVTVEIALTTAPMASSPSWTDVTAYVDQQNYPIQIDRGRGDAQSTAEPGVCTFTLNNDDKRFTPGYTGGTYGDDVTVGRLVRVTITHNSTTYRRFTGYITSFDLEWPGGVTQQNRVHVTAVDILGLMAQVRLRNIIDHLYLTSGPIALWPLDDGPGTGDAQEITGYRNPGLHRVIRGGGGTCRFDNGRGIPAIPDKWSRAVRIKSDRDSNSWTALGTTIDLKGATASVGFGGWINFDAEEISSNDPYIASLSLADGGAGAESVVIAALANGRSYAAWLDNSGNETPGQEGRRIISGGWHHLWATYEEAGNGTLTFYVDGDEMGSLAYGANYPILGSTAQVTIGAGRQPDGDKPAANPTNARYAYWGVWTDTVATGIDPDVLYQAGGADWDSGDRTSARVGRVLDWMGVPSNRQDLERGLSDVSIGNLKDLTALDYVQQCVTGEQGFFFQAGDGTATFHARDHRWDAATSAATLSWHHPDETFTTDLEQIINSVTVDHQGGSVRVSDETSRILYGPRELSVDTQLSTPLQANGIAEYVLKLRETMKPRMSEFTYDLLTEDTQSVRDDVLGLDLGSLFTVDSLPTQAHDTELDFWVEGLRETISIDEWRVTYVTTPYKEFTGFWVLGTTAIDDGLKLGY